MLRTYELSAILRRAFQIFTAVLGLLLGPSALGAGNDTFSDFPCRKDRSELFELKRTDCDNAQDKCKVMLFLKRGDKIIDRKELGISIFSPAGNIEERSNSAWWVSHFGDTTGAQGKVSIEARQGRFGEAESTLLVSSTSVGAAEGLPAAKYEYYRCSQGKLSLIWSGGDDASREMGSLLLKDVNGDGIDEIIFYYADVIHANLPPEEVKVFAWDEKKRAMEPKKALQAKLPTFAEIKKAREDEIFTARKPFKGKPYDSNECTNARKALTSCNVQNSSCELSSKGKTVIHCYFIPGRDGKGDGQRLSREVKKLGDRCQLQDIFVAADGKQGYEALECRF